MNPIEMLLKGATKGRQNSRGGGQAMSKKIRKPANVSNSDCEGSSIGGCIGQTMPAVPKARNIFSEAKPSLGYSQCLRRKAEIAEHRHGCIFENPLALEDSMGRRKIDCGSHRSNEAGIERKVRSLEFCSQGQKMRLRRADLLPKQQQLLHRIESKDFTIRKQSVKLKTGGNGCNPASITRRSRRRKFSLDPTAKSAIPTSTHHSMSPNATSIPLLDDCEIYSTDHSNSDEDCLEFNLAEDKLLRSGKEHYEQGVAGCCTPVCDILSSSLCSPVSEVGSLSLKSLVGLDNLVKDRGDDLELGTLDDWVGSDSSAGSLRSTDARNEAYCIYPGWSLWSLANREQSMSHDSNSCAPSLRRFSSVKSLRSSLDQHLVSADEQYHFLRSPGSSSRRLANGNAVVRSLEPSFRKAGLFTAKVYQSVASTRKCSISASPAFEEAKLPLLNSQRNLEKHSTTRKRPVTFLTEGLKSLASKGLPVTGLSFPSVIPIPRCSIPKFDKKPLLKPERLLYETQSRKLLNQKGASNEPQVETSPLNGYIQQIFKHGVTSYSFWMDDFDEVFVAKAESADGECKCFTFYSCKGKDKGGWHWQKIGKPIVNLVGTMNVSRSVYAEVDCQGEIMHYMDSQFSLLDERVQKKQFPANMLQKIRESSTKLNKPLLKASVSSYFRTLWNNLLVNSDYEAGIKCRKELAAMVVRVPLRVKKDSSYVEARSNNVRKPLGRFFRSRQQEQRTVSETPWGSIVGNASETITVILPAGDHGHPTYGLEGPRPLVDRWRSGGLCDCGSWDLGCGIAILSKDYSVSGPANQEDKLPLNILVEGRKQKVVAMSLAPCQDGLFRVSYQEPMLSLQAFATAVAILHSKFSSAENKDYRSQERQTKLSCTLTARPKENSRRTSMGCHPNPPLSPIDRL